MHAYDNYIQRKFVHDSVEFAKRFLSARARLLVGFEHEKREFDPNRDPRHICPNSQVIRKFSKVTGKVESIVVPCGRCLYCKHRSQNGLIYRMYEHNKAYKNNAFVTLTMDDLHYTEDPKELRVMITKFLKRFRKSLNDNTFTYYMVCERGDLRNRCHFHLIMWWNGIASGDLVKSLVLRAWYARGNDYTFSDFQSLLNSSYGIPVTPIGIVHFDYGFDTSICAYVTKYVSESQKKLVFRSWSLGLGSCVLESNPTLLAQLMYLNVIKYCPDDKTYSIPVPRYYKQKVFTQAERDIMFMDYLASPDCKRQMDILKDLKTMHDIIDVYKSYEERSLNAYRARCKEKARKKRLL